MFFNKVNLRLFFKQTCQLCRLQPAQLNGLCEDCHADLPWRLFPCPVCGLSRTSPMADCPDCQRLQPAFDHTCVALDYRFPLTQLLPAIKYHQQLRTLGWLAPVLAAQIRDTEQALPHCLLPVPMHPWDQLRRGHNQAALLAEQLGRQLNIPVQYQALQKIRHTRKQHRLSARQRRHNLQGAFALNKPLPSHVALVDDVMTTGSTLNEIARLLKSQGVLRVDNWVIARTPESQDSTEETDEIE